MYKLYHNKNGRELEVSKVKENQKWFLGLSCNDNEIVRYNDCYYVSKSRKALNELAKQIRAEWIKEAEEVLEKYRKMEIKRSYS